MGKEWNGCGGLRESRGLVKTGYSLVGLREEGGGRGGWWKMVRNREGDERWTRVEASDGEDEEGQLFVDVG